MGVLSTWEGSVGGEASLPDASNCGYLGDPGALTSVSGSTVSTPGAVIQSRNISGDLYITAANVTVRNCILNGGYFGVDTNGNAHNLIVEDCTVLGGSNCGILSQGNGAIIRRNNISGGSDGMKIAGDDVLVDFNYIHDLYSGDADPHHDGIQCGSGAGMTFTRNRIVSKDTSCIAMFAGQGTWSDILIQANHLTGPVSFTYYSPGTASSVRVLDNVLDGWVYGPVSDWVTGGGNAWSGNVRTNGTTVNP